ncbi:MAG: transglycosylase SLT domain-containing protein, partial [Methylobacteriaceae bacterium]|nr:transglycosylase SLT domain-containing protein [Methylobacteriaceae bacterium]
APAVIAIEPAPVFAPSPEEREQASVETGRQEVEEFLRFGQRELPKRLVETIVQAAITTEVDPIYLMALADKESSFRTEVKASTSSAEGLFQFIDRTWLEVVKSFGPKHGLAEEADAIELADGKATVADPVVKSRVLDLRRDPYVAAVMAAELLKRDAALIGFKIGRKLTRTEMYIAHFLGLEDATRFIAMKARRKPASAVAAFPAAARANAAIFYAVDKRKRKPRGLSVPEVYARLDSMIEPRAARYRGVETVAGL